MSAIPAKSRRRPNNQQRGFSLLELMIVLAIIAVVSALAVPSLVSFIKNSRLDSESESLVVMINKTRQLAISSGRRAFLCRSDDVNTPACLTVTGDADWAYSKLVYLPLIGLDTGVPNGDFVNQAFQTITAANSAEERTQMLVTRVERSADSILTVNANFDDNVIVFSGEGQVINPGVPLRIAVCDDRNTPELFGRYVEISPTGRTKVRQTSDQRDEVNCQAAINP